MRHNFQTKYQESWCNDKWKYSHRYWNAYYFLTENIVFVAGCGPETYCHRRSLHANHCRDGACCESCFVVLNFVLILCKCGFYQLNNSDKKYGAWNRCQFKNSVYYVRSWIMQLDDPRFPQWVLLNSSNQIQFWFDYIVMDNTWHRDTVSKIHSVPLHR